MGSAVGRRLRANGASVRTRIAGRSAATSERARASGLDIAERIDDLVDNVDILLSIVPPGQARALAAELRAPLERAAHPPVYVDCNALAPATMREIAELLAPTGCRCVDAGIIGGPPGEAGDGPRFYLSGDAAPEVRILEQYGLSIRMLPGAIGDASALKMSYAGITKGLTALGAAMAAAATRAGVDDALHAELEASQPALLAWLARAVPGMYPKAYRWVAEMEEIASFLHDPRDGAAIYRGAATLYERLADAHAGGDLDELTRFYSRYILLS